MDHLHLRMCQASESWPCNTLANPANSFVTFHELRLSPRIVLPELNQGLALARAAAKLSPRQTPLLELCTGGQAAYLGLKQLHQRVQSDWSGLPSQEKDAQSAPT